MGVFSYDLSSKSELSFVLAITVSSLIVTVVLAYMRYVSTRGFWDRTKDGVLCRTRVVV